MKIPAHLLSPVANSSKGAQNAPVQSVAEFLSEQSETPKDFFSALKSLQNLVKPQKADGQQPGTAKGAASLATKSVATKVAELKFVDPKIENMEPQESDQDASQELMQTKDDVAVKPSEVQSGIKGVSIERSATLEEKLSEPGTPKITDDAEQVPENSDEAELEKALIRSVDVNLAKIFGARSPAKISAAAQSMAQSPANTDPAMDNSKPVLRAETNAPLVERNAASRGSIGLDARSAVDSVASVARVQRPALSNDENSPRTDGTRLEVGRAPMGEAKNVDPVAVRQSEIITKSEAKIDIQPNPRSGAAEVSFESKSTLENASQIQIKAGIAPQPNTTNMTAPLTAPTVSSRDISAQVTRHLNSELLNMDLRTQVVSERAVTGALNSSVLTLQLHPVGLGRVQAEIRKEGELVRIKLTVEAKGTFEILKNDIDALKTAMRALGTSEGDVTLTQGNINRLPNDATSNGQNFFSSERDTQSDLRERQDRDPNARSEQQPGGEDNASLVRISDHALQDVNNTVFI